MLNYYRKDGVLGIISLNDWEIIPLPFAEGDSASHNIINGSTGEISYSTSSLSNRGMADASVFLDDSYTLDKNSLEKHLCQECLDKVSESLEYRKESNEDPAPVCIVDFKTLDIHPLQNIYVGYFIGDYWLNIKRTDNRIDILMYYLPERDELN